MNTPEEYFYETFSKSELLVKESPLKIKKDKKRLTIGVPKEEDIEENRVALVPHSVQDLVLLGHKIIIESGAGEKSSFSDNDYSEAGAIISNDKKEVFQSDIIVKTSPPLLKEVDLFSSGQILISPLQLITTSKELIKNLLQKRVIAIATEYIQAPDGSLPLVKMMSEITGKVAVLTAAEYMTNTSGNKILLGGISGVPPAKVVILGADMYGEHAVRTALALGASVSVFDNDIYKIMNLKSITNQNFNSYILNPVYLKQELANADVVIAAIHSKNGKVPTIITEEMVMTMKKGAIIIDISIDQGGCVETSKMTTHSNPVFLKHDVLHYCVPNIPSKVSNTASIAISNILTPMIMETGQFSSKEDMFYKYFGLRAGIYTYKGSLTNKFLAGYFDMKYSPLDLLMASGL